VSRADGTASAESLSAFSIIASPTVLTITSPVGGEQWQQNSTHQITFSNCVAGTTYYVKVMRSGVEILNLTAYTATGTTGSVSWTITTPIGTDYKVQVVSANGLVSASSPSVFSVTSSGGGGGGTSDMTMIIIVVVVVVIVGGVGAFMYMRGKKGK
jgi:hypothetical protein